MNKMLKMVFNILTAAAALGVLFMIFMIKDEVVKNANKEERNVMGSYDYEVSHRAYGEIADTYYVYDAQLLKVPEGFEESKLTAEYAKQAFMLGVYEEKGDEKKVGACKEKMENLKTQMDKYRFTADEIDEMLSAY